jgi:hypothetical protein
MQGHFSTKEGIMLEKHPRKGDTFLYIDPFTKAEKKLTVVDWQSTTREIAVVEDETGKRDLIIIKHPKGFNPRLTLLKSAPQCEHGNPLMDCKECDDWLHNHSTVSAASFDRGPIRRA